MFKYLETHNQNYLSFDTCYHDITSDEDTEAKVWVVKGLYSDAADKLPSNVPKLRGRPIYINFLWTLIMPFIGLIDTLRLVYSYISTVQTIIFYSKHQNTVEI